MEKKEIVNHLGLFNYLKGYSYNKKNIKCTNTTDKNEKTVHSFLITDDKHQQDYDVKIICCLNEVVDYNCTCDVYKNDKSCEHIAAAMVEFNLDTSSDYSVEYFSNKIVNELLNKENEVEYLKVYLAFEFSKKGKFISVKPKIGTDKLSSIATKFSAFYSSYVNNQDNDLVLGKYFTYNPSNYKFQGKYLKIIDFLVNKFGENRSRNIRTASSLDISYHEFEYLVELLASDKFEVIDAGKYNKIEEGCAYKISIDKYEDKYTFVVDFKSGISLDKDFTYTKNKGDVNISTLYRTPLILKNLYKLLQENELDELVLDEKQALLLSKKLYFNIKDCLEINQQIADKFIIQTPKVKIYLDLHDKLTAKINFEYNEGEINYFDKLEVYRNEYFENMIVEEIVSYNFKKEENIHSIEPLDKIVEFIEEHAYHLNEKYEVFSSSRLNAANIVNNSSIKSQFSLGKDNIIKYDFDLGDIDRKELGNIFDSIKEKRKYYKLKNGDIINTEDKSLIELKEVYDTLELDYEEESGVVPKYRMLYLDSIKDYNIIETDNTFSEFMRNFNEYKNNDINISKEDQMILRDYQQTGVKWLYNIYKFGFGGILADEMGLGKTIQTIMFIKQVISENSNHKILIVAPTALIYNWEAEFDKFGSELKYKVIADNKEKRMKALEEDYNVYITTYGLLRQDEQLYMDKKFELVIIDEGQNIKNPKAGISRVVKKINSNVNIALTGTPVENSVLEVWSIFDFIMPGYLSNLSKFQNKYNVKDLSEDSKDVLRLLSNLIKPFILRRKKKEVLVDLPDKIENNIYLDLLPEQKKLYAATVKKNMEEYEKLVKESGFMNARMKILALIMRLRQLCVDPSIVYEDYENCSVKMNEILPLLTNYIDNGHKVLIFTSFRTGLDLIKKKLDENLITSYVINGSVSSKRRKELVDNFNKDNTNVFLITLKAGGTGLNLTSADVVIHFDLWWNPQVENQATDRAHRIGQKNTVEVVKLICKGTIEEKIIQLQEKKKILNDTIIDNDNEDIDIANLTEADIKDLLSYNGE